MVSPHLWPGLLKRLVFVLAALFVVIAYATLCSGLVALATLFS